METNDNNEDYDEATMAMLCANLPSNVFNSSTPDPRLQRAWQETERTNQVTPILKEELRFYILAKRLKKGEPEIDTTSDVPKNYELTEEEMRKKERRKEQNRKAAKKCREKRKMKSLSEAEITDNKRKENQRLRDEVLRLNFIVSQLQRYLDEHLRSDQCLKVKPNFEPMTHGAEPEALRHLPLTSFETPPKEIRKRPYPFTREKSSEYLSGVQNRVAEFAGPSGSFPEGVGCFPDGSILPEHYTQQFISPELDTQGDMSGSQGNGSEMPASPRYFPYLLPRTSAFQGFSQCSEMAADQSSVSDDVLAVFMTYKPLNDTMSDAASQSTINERLETDESVEAGNDFLENYNFLSETEQETSFSEYPMEDSDQFLQACPPSPLTPLSPVSPSFPPPTSLPSTPSQTMTYILGNEGLISPCGSKENPARPPIRRTSSCVSVPSPYGGLQSTSSISPPPSVPSPASHGLPESPPILQGFAPLDEARYFTQYSPTSSVAAEADTFQLADHFQEQHVSSSVLF
ncbi:uncharacterized protein LOC106061796 isoform X3 [Biomphalaria glabrata]|nr:uncharacterized protein LOC106061796 isoform X3 [Biomphalaria glabrata]XP_055878926.1 uncharacterized protein LOC106061796 isoform X3 [Biomphalaria glabrata]XP_055878927.1 uncharacterized protein LOC106061796 isoform X3 [Biomphalaria glabrata]XP_055878928.1 uncharacterized protein LOC106061796 isoform X3 [Biomphalaria glabrata]